LLGDLRATDREESQAQCVGDRQGVSGWVAVLGVEERGQCRGDADEDVYRARDPEYRTQVEQHVADRAAANRGDDRQHGDAEDVHALAAGGQCAARGEDGDP
jgi:hypothetical protein